MSRITISFTRHDKDVVDHIKEIEPNERSHEIVKALRQHWFVCENSTCEASACETASSSIPVEEDKSEGTASSSPIDEEARREAQRIRRERIGRSLRTQGLHTKDTQT